MRFQDKSNSLNREIVDMFYYVNNGFYKVRSCYGNLYVNVYHKKQSEDNRVVRYLNLEIFSNNKNKIKRIIKYEKKSNGYDFNSIYGNKSIFYINDYPKNTKDKYEMFDDYMYLYINNSTRYYVSNSRIGEEVFIDNKWKTLNFFNVDTFVKKEEHKFLKNNIIWTKDYKMGIDIINDKIYLSINNKIISISSYEDVYSILKDYKISLLKLKKFISNEVSNLKSIMNINYDFKFNDKEVDIDAYNDMAIQLNNIKEVFVKACNLFNFRYDDDLLVSVLKQFNDQLNLFDGFKLNDYYDDDFSSKISLLKSGIYEFKINSSKYILCIKPNGNRYCFYDEKGSVIYIKDRNVMYGILSQIDDIVEKQSKEIKRLVK